MPLLWSSVMTPVLAGLSAGPLLLLVFGSMCRHTGEYCGPSGQDRGGITMIVFGSVLSFVLVLGIFTVQLQRYGSDGERHTVALYRGYALAWAYALGVLLCSFGSICVVTDGGDKLCGAGGERGGRGMLIAGSALLF